MKLREGGFTLVEVICVLFASSIIIGVIVYFGLAYWQYSAELDGDLTTFVGRLNAQDYIRDKVGTTDGLIMQNSIPDPHANNPDPIAGANYWLPLHAVPQNLSAVSGTTTPILYFRRFSIDTSKAVAMNGTVPYDDEYIFYIDGTNRKLMVRTLANPNIANNMVKTSCPPNIATASCPADKEIIDNLASMDVVYYSRNGSTINYQSIIDPYSGAYAGPDFPSVEAIQYNIHVRQKTILQKSNTVINDTIVRIALRNT